MNPQNNPARIRAKRDLAQLFKDIAFHADIVLSRKAYEHIDQIVDDIIDAAVDQMKSETYFTPQNVIASIMEPGCGTGGIVSNPPYAQSPTAHKLED